MSTVRCKHCSELLFSYAEPIVKGTVLRADKATDRHGKPEVVGQPLWDTFPVCPGCKTPLGGWNSTEVCPDMSTLTPAEAVYAFAGWLTSRDASLTIGSTHDAAPVADLVTQFCNSQGFAPPRPEWHRDIKPYPVNWVQGRDGIMVPGDPV